MFPLRNLPLLGMLLLLALGCNYDPLAVSIYPMQTTAEPEPGKAIVFKFNRDVLSDSMMIGRENPNMLRISPEWPGRCVFTSMNTVEFLPLKPPVPGQTYEFAMTPDLLQNVPDCHIGTTSAAKVTAAPLKLLETQAQWMEGTSPEAPPRSVHLRFRFNYPVKSSELAAFLSMKAESGEVLAPQWGELQQGKEIQCHLVPSAEGNFDATLQLKPGMLSAVGGQPMVESPSKRLQLDDISRLEVKSITPYHDGWEGEVKIQLSQKGLTAGMEEWVEINPKVPFVLTADASGFAVVSKDFMPGETYEITLKKGLKGVLGGQLPHEYTESVHFRGMNPTIRFADRRASILSRDGLRNLRLNIWGCKEVKATLRKIYANNLLASDAFDDYDWWYNDEDAMAPDDTDDEVYYRHEGMTDVVWEKTFSTKDLPQDGASKILTLNVADKHPMDHGIYLLELDAPELDYWSRAQKVISLTDIGLMAKQGNNKWLVFANSIRTGAALPNVQVKMMGENNQEVESQFTDASGIAVFTLRKDLPSGYSPALITAQRQEDFSYLFLSQHEVNTSRFDVEGKVISNTGLEGMIYGERNIYRPGETVHLAAIVRNGLVQSPGAIPVQIELKTPDYERYRLVRKTLNAQGATDASFEIPLTAPTGSWTANIYATNEVLLGSTEIKIEEFMPDRLKSTLSLGKDTFLLGDTVRMELSAASFFGPPAAYQAYEMSLNLEAAYFSPKGYDRYTFFGENQYRYFDPQQWSQSLDSAGKATETWTATTNLMGSGMLSGVVRSTVFDETGRPVHRKKYFTLHTQRQYMGISLPETYCPTGKPVQARFIALNPSGKPIEAEAEVRVIRHEFYTTVSTTNSYFHYESHERDTLLMSKTLRLGTQPTAFSFTPDLSGSYEIQLREPDAAWHTSASFQVYGQGRTTFTSFRVNRDGNIDIASNKSSYKVGETAKLLLKGPFSGKMLVTVEGTEVMKHFYVQTDRRVAEVNIPITADMAPNVYVTATLIKPHQPSDIPLTVAHGVLSLDVENPATHLALSISAVEKSRSDQRQTIRVKTAPFASVTIAAVDEGILQVGKMITPDPHPHFYAHRGMMVKWYDHYKYLLPEARARSSTGGDGYGLENRLNPLPNRRVKLVSFWSGTLQADAQGNVVFPIQIPHFSGAIRIMAIAHKGNAFASAEKEMVVADPLVISTALPRVMAPSDTLEMPVFVYNTEGKEVEAEYTLALEGPLKLLAQPTQKFRIPANREHRLDFRLAALPNVGECKVTVKVKGLNQTFTDETEITVRPNVPLQFQSGSGEAKGGETAEIQLKNGGYLPATRRGKLVVGRSPMVQFSRNLEELVQYPHGCVEQTVSAAFPQLYFGDLVRDLYQASTFDPNPAANVRAALTKLMLMQRYNGGLSYWPQGGDESWWGSVWAAHFVVEAEKAGYEVDPGFKDRLLSYLTESVQKKPTESWYLGKGQLRYSAPREVPYSLYVLALAGRPDRSLMNYYKSRPELLRTDGQYLLAAAFALAGEPERGLAILPGALNPQEYGNSNNPSFASYVRDQALVLNVLLEVAPNHPQVNVLTQQVSKNLRTVSNLNTQEHAFGLLAMGKVARRTARSTATGEIWQGNEKVGVFDGKTATWTDKQLAMDKPLTLKTAGSGPLYWFRESSGVPVKETRKSDDAQIAVRRRYLHTDGSEISGGYFTQNDLVVVEITLRSLISDEIPNVAVTDVLPACLEVENPRLNNLMSFAYPQKETYPEFRDFRDDRICFFDKATPNSTRVYYYLARAVSLGTFQGSYVGADAMYDGTIHSFQGGETIHVVRKQGQPEAL